MPGCFARRLAEANGVGRIALIVTRNGLAVSAYEDDPAWMDDPAVYPLWQRRPVRCSGFRIVIFRCDGGDSLFDGHGGRIAAGVSNDLASPRRRCNAQRTPPVDTCPARSSRWVRSTCVIWRRFPNAEPVICPAAPSFYPHPRNIEDLCGTIVERVLTLLDVEVPHYEWGAFHPEPDHQ